MTYSRDLLVQELEFDEGRRKKPYTDTRGKITIGVGINLADGLSDDLIDLMRDAKIAECERELDREKPWWRELSDNRQRVVLNMQYNLGWPKFEKFRLFWEALEARNYSRAATEMRNSVWATQVGERSLRLQRLMEHG